MDFAAASGALGLLEVAELALLEEAGLLGVIDLLAELEGVFGAACLGVVTLTGLLAIFSPFCVTHSAGLWLLIDCGLYTTNASGSISPRAE